MRIYVHRFKVYDIEIKSDNGLSFLKGLEDIEGVDFWTLPSQLNLNATVLASPVLQSWLELGLSDLGIGFSVRNDDLERY